MLSKKKQNKNKTYLLLHFQLLRRRPLNHYNNPLLVQKRKSSKQKGKQLCSEFYYNSSTAYLLANAMFT